MISIVLNTSQDLHPILGPFNGPKKTYLDVNIFDYLIYKLEEQLFEDFELIIIDKYFENRKHWVGKKYLHLKFPFKYCPPKPNPWPDSTTTISNDRNSGLLLSSGDFIICLDDCVVPMNPGFLTQMIFYYEFGILLRPLVYEYNYMKTPPDANEDPLVQWNRDQVPEYQNTIHRVSGNCSRCYALPSIVFEHVNGFDERCDGAWGSEDGIFYALVDNMGIKRYILPKNANQHHVGRAHHDHQYKKKMTDLVCNQAYSQWIFKRIQAGDLEPSNQRILDSNDISDIGLMCKDCRLNCSRKNQPGYEYYRKIQPCFSLKDDRKKILDKYSETYGVFDPWQNQ